MKSKPIEKIEELILKYQEKLPDCFSSKEFEKELEEIIKNE